jgi:hypothetical protein
MCVIVLYCIVCVSLCCMVLYCVCNCIVLYVCNCIVSLNFVGFSTEFAAYHPYSAWNFLGGFCIFETLVHP